LREQADERWALIEAADLATEMQLLKHPFRSGVKAQAGIEF
jgi:cob(I)alamin adenosyltransferase